ncbi:MAG: class I SAM-dependent methyltransferase [Methylococcales bacterium]
MTQQQSEPTVGHDKIKQFYDTEYYGPETVQGLLPWHTRVIAGRLGDLSDKQVLDVACGNGAWLAELASRGARVAGIDISTRAVEACRARLADANIHEGIAEALPFEAGYFDIVTCLGSLEHFINQLKALQEMRRVAKPDARFPDPGPELGFPHQAAGTVWWHPPSADS